MAASFLFKFGSKIFEIEIWEQNIFLIFFLEKIPMLEFYASTVVKISKELFLDIALCTKENK